MQRWKVRKVLKKERNCLLFWRVCITVNWEELYGSLQIITRVSYIWLDLWHWSCWESCGGRKGGSDITVAALDCCVRRISVQYSVGSQEQICIPILCIYDPVCTRGIVSDGTSALQAAETQKIQKSGHTQDKGEEASLRETA